MIKCRVSVPALPTSDNSYHSVLCRHTAIENNAILDVANKRDVDSENWTANSTGIQLSKAIDFLGNENHQGFKSRVLWFLCYEVLPSVKYQKPTYYVSQYHGGIQPRFTDTVGKNVGKNLCA